jgi:hypothetical protein
LRLLAGDLVVFQAPTVPKALPGLQALLAPQAVQVPEVTPRNKKATTEKKGRKATSGRSVR